MEKIFASPSRYIQGRGVLITGIPYILKLGKKGVLLTDEFVWNLVGTNFYDHLLAEGMVMEKELFAGETSEKEIQRITKKLKEESIEVVLSLGGGKVIDVGKAIANALDIAVVVLPTTASTDAPTSSISVLYEEDGRFKEYQFYKKNPELVLVDTEVIAQAPVRLLVSGMADALSTAVEARAVNRSCGVNTLGGKPTLAALAIAEKCEAIIFEFGLQAIEANRAKVVTESLEAVIEANTLLSGLGFESAGLAAAHAIHNGFSVLQGDIQRLTHGEKVAFGTLTQLFLENQSREIIDQYIQFYQVLGLPTTLAELGLPDTSFETLVVIGEQAKVKGDSLDQMPMALSSADLASAMKAVDAYVNTYFPK